MTTVGDMSTMGTGWDDLCRAREIPCGSRDAYLYSHVWSHSLSSCSFSHDAMTWLVDVLKKMDPTVNKDKTIFLQINPTVSGNKQICVWLVAESLQYIWAKRRAKEKPTVERLRAKILAELEVLKCTRSYRHIAFNLTNFI